MKEPMRDIKKSLDATVFKDSQFSAKHKHAVFQKIHKRKTIYVLPALVSGLLLTVAVSTGIYFASERIGGESPNVLVPNQPVSTEIPPRQGEDGTETVALYEAKEDAEVSMEDAETAYALCVNALTDYYNAIWNGTEIDVSKFIVNENLKQYLETKIQSETNKYGTMDSKVKQLEIDDWEVTFTDDEKGGYLYLKVPVSIQKHDGGGYGEGTEFFVRNVDGKLTIVDWYTGGKDTYDYLVRGYEQKISNPNVWNNHDWVKKFKSGTGLYNFEQQVYDRFKLTHDANELIGLEPISIAKLYAYASYHQDFETAYALYTDREEHILWSEEEDEQIPLAERGTPEQVLETFKGLERGSFIQTSDYEGFIKFYPNGEQHEESGFSMMKNEEGIWQVAFLPVQ